MKKSLFSISVATLLALTSIPAKALDDNLVYVAIDPCRIVDTRPPGAGGEIAADNFRNFKSSGTGGDLSSQGGNAAGCEGPETRKGLEPVAITAYVLAVKTATSGSGVLSVYPAGNPQPPVGSGSTVNFAAQQIIGNTTTISLGNNSEFAVLARNTNQHVIVDVQGYFYATPGCSDDMIAVGSLCVDKYEASVWDAATGGTQFNPTGDPGTSIPCDTGGADCSDGEANEIYARSVAGVIPALNVTWYQAAIACANVDKRLPTTAEWQMAAAGTPEGTGTACNAVGPAGAVTTTDISTCVSSIGAYDMVGNVAEWAAELDIGSGPSNDSHTTTNHTIVRGLGQSWALNGGAATTKEMRVLIGTGGANFGALTSSSRLGFRCVR